jgi:hypothetical protein
MSVQSEAPAVLSLADLTPEQYAALMAQAAQNIVKQAEADKAQRAADKKAHDARMVALTPYAQSFADALFVEVPETLTSTSQKEHDEDPSKPLKYTRKFQITVMGDEGKPFTIFGYLSPKRAKKDGSDEE